MLFIALVASPQFPALNGHSQTFQNEGVSAVSVTSALQAGPSAALNYNPSAAVNYAYLIHTRYFGTPSYPAGINESILQKNLDHYNSEDCAHFVSEALIAGGLKVLAQNPPGDNLTTFDSGAFVGSYGIVGVYRLADYLAGYDLPVFPANATTEHTMGYQPIPGSYSGSPHASVYYVLNDSILPSYILSPGDVIMDGGAGSGHAMLYVGHGSVIQTDPAGQWAYAPGVDYNISFYGLLTLNGKNVSSLYMHMPTFSSRHTVNITVLTGGRALNANSSVVARGSRVSLIASFPDGVGYGNYTYRWSVNGRPVSTNQSFAFNPSPGRNSISVVSAGSSGNATGSYTISVPVSGNGSTPSTALLALSAAGVVIVASAMIVLYRRRK